MTRPWLAAVLATALAVAVSQSPAAHGQTATDPAAPEPDPLAPIPLVLDPTMSDPTATALPDGNGIAPDGPTLNTTIANTPLTNTQTSIAVAATDAPGAILRGLDKVAGQTTDLTVKNGETIEFGTLKVALSDCRFPTDNPAADAYAHLSITEAAAAAPPKNLFDGWMVASSPALSALDHPRYDIWVIRCTRP